MEKTRKYSQQEKEKIVKKYLNSGMYGTEFIVDYDIPIKTFYKWVKIYKDKQPVFIDVTNEIKNDIKIDNDFTNMTYDVIEIIKDEIVYKVRIDQIQRLLEVLK